MRFWVGVTDNDWYAFLAARRPDEVNFWRPNPRAIRALPAGGLFLFKLHAPLRCIAGGGFFVRYEDLPLSMAWDVFGQTCGAPDLFSLLHAIQRRRKDAQIDSRIGCIVLNQPFFFPHELWIPEPSDWHANIVTAKSYDTDEAVGRRLWHEVQERLRVCDAIGDVESAHSLLSDAPRFGKEYLARARLGQGAFRLLVAAAYRKRCTVTGERAWPVLEAAHIKDHALSGPNQVSNGLLLRSDLHRLFDKGYVTVTPALRVRVSRRLRDEFDNGEEYLRYQDAPLLTVPEDRLDMPRREFLEWHNETRFRR